MQETWYENSPFRQVDNKAAEQQWRDAVEKTLSGRRFEDELISTTLDGIEINPLYQQSVTTAPLITQQPDWRITQSFPPRHQLSDELPQLNTEILDALAGGVSAIELAPRCNTLEQLNLLLSDVYPQMIHLSLPPAANNLDQAALLEALWRKHSLTPELMHGAFNADPLGALAQSGKICVADGHYATSLGELACHTHEHLPQVRSVCVDTSPYHNAGASEAQELGFALATGTDYLRALTSAGLTIDDASRQIVFRFALDSDFFLSIAKLRAVRQLWQHLLSHCGAKDTGMLMQLDAVSGNRNLSARDSWVNILRVTSQAFAAMIGGASGFNCASYDINLDKQSGLGRRIARNTQLILAEESHIRAVSDPLRGSGFIEAMTQQLCTRAWAIFQEIESSNGMWESLQTDFIVESVAKTREARLQAVSVGQTAIVGVTEYPDMNEKLSTGESGDSHAAIAVLTGSENSTISAVSQRDRVTALLNGESLCSFNRGSSSGDSSHEAAGGSLSSGALSERSLEEVIAPALKRYRDAEIYETMLKRSQLHEERTGAAPGVLLVTVGSASYYTARTSFCRNFFATAGIGSRIVAFEELATHPLSETPLAILCSSSQLYATAAPDACKTIASSSGAEVWLAGLAGDLEQQLTKNGMTEQIHAQCNKADLLNRALNLLTVAKA